MKSRIGLWKMAQVLSHMAPRHWWLGGAVMATLTVAMGMALLGLSGWFIAATAIAGLLPATAMVFDVFMPSAGIRLLAMGRTASRYGERLLTHEVTLAVLAVLRVQLFLGWAQPRAAQQLQLRPATLLQRLTADVDALDSLYLRWIVPIFAATGAALLAGVVLGFLKVWLGVLVAGWMLLAGGGWVCWLSLRSHMPALQRMVALEQLRTQSVDVVAGQTELLMAGQLPEACARAMQLDARVEKADQQLNRLDAKAATGLGMAGAITLAGVLAAVGLLVEAGEISTPGAVLGLLVALTAMEPFSALRRGALETGRMRLAVRRLGPRMQTGSEPEPESLAPTPLAVGQAFCVNAAVVQHAGSKVPALCAVNLQVPQGEKVVLIGRSGAGKSTLLEVLAGEIPLSAGSVAALPCVWLTQRVALFQDTIRDNLRLAAPHASDASLWDVLEDAGLAADVRGMPQGLNTALGEGGQGLSSGQARRLGLARLFLADASCWLLDEPTEGLDAPTARDVMQRLMRRAVGKTVVLSTHLQREASMADTLVCLSDGSVQAQAKKGAPSFEAYVRCLRLD